LNRYLDASDNVDSKNSQIQELARDKFMALPNFYTKSTDRYQYTNMDDAMGSLRQEELIAIARLIRDDKYKEAGIALKDALMRVLTDEAEDELEEDY